MSFEETLTVIQRRQKLRDDLDALYAEKRNLEIQIVQVGDKIDRLKKEMNR